LSSSTKSATEAAVRDLELEAMSYKVSGVHSAEVWRFATSSPIENICCPEKLRYEDLGVCMHPSATRRAFGKRRIGGGPLLRGESFLRGFDVEVILCGLKKHICRNVWHCIGVLNDKV
jgi:hypothetical protein